jgi:hypothetical protein
MKGLAMKRIPPFLLLTLCLPGCLAAAPSALKTEQDPTTRAPQGMLSVNIRWPERQTQTIPLSTQTIRLRVSQGDTVLHDLPLGRPEASDSALVSGATLLVDAGTGFTIRADAYRTSPVSSGDVPIASDVQSNVTIHASQKNPVALDLHPVFVPTLTGVSPTNGGPGVKVTLTGSFSDSGSYQMSLSGKKIQAASGSILTAEVPVGASTGAVIVLDDGVPSLPGGTFSVLAALNATASTLVTTVGASVPFSVPTGMDTAGLSIVNPTITRWKLIDPARLSLPGDDTSPIGTLDQDGLFTATATGSAHVYVFSGTLLATLSVTVNERAS